jgi:hypothetical protein
MLFYNYWWRFSSGAPAFQSVDYKKCSIRHGGDNLQFQSVVDVAMKWKQDKKCNGS